MLTYVLAVLAACANATSSVLQRKANLSVVEPILVIELPATLIVASRVFGAPMHRRELW